MLKSTLLKLLLALLPVLSAAALPAIVSAQDPDLLRQYPELAPNATVRVVAAWNDGTYAYLVREYPEMQGAQAVKIYQWDNGRYTCVVNEYPELRPDGNVYGVQFWCDATWKVWLIGPAAVVAPPPTPAPAPAPAFPYRVTGPGYEHNCGTTWVDGLVLNADGSQRSDAWVALWTFGTFQGMKKVGNGDGPGGYDFIFQGGAPRAMRFEVAVVDESGALQSPRVAAETNETGCDVAGSGRQHARIDFTRN
jgi:hypothetical protein